MRRRLATRFVVVLSLVLLPLGIAPTADEGIVLPGVDGGRLTEADLGSGATILVVWASWSPRCRDVAPRIAALATSWSSRARVASVAFQEEPAKIGAFLAGRDLGAPVYVDDSGVFSKKHAVTTLPTLLVFRDGETVFRGKLPIHPDPVIERVLASE